VWNSAAVTATAFVSTVTGVSLAVVVPSPS
jgi:hypothetical protein